MSRVPPGTGGPQASAGQPIDDGATAGEATWVLAGARLPRVSPRWRARLSGLRTLHWWKLPLFLASLFLFILAITLMKDSAQELGPLVRDRLDVTGFVDAVGFGWLMSYIIMSGSPVAATALTFLSADVVDRYGAYGMIVGSRMGASFIVLLIGFLYVLRGRDRTRSLGMGLVSLSVAASMQVLAFGPGLYIIHSGIADGYSIGAGAALGGLMDNVVDPISHALAARLPGAAVFVMGLVTIMISFSLFDRCLPEMSLRKTGVGTISRFVYRPWVMFLMGCAITMVSMSVSISLGVLVPLSERGLVRRENVIPYIMGANISTFIDTLIAAVLLGVPGAFEVVLAEMLSLALVAAVILLINYDWYERRVLDFVEWISADTQHLVAFLVVIVLVPVMLLVFG